MREVRTTFADWASLTARLYADDSMEVEWFAGPLPSIGQRVTEVIVRYIVSGPGLAPKTEGQCGCLLCPQCLSDKKRRSGVRR